MAAPARRLVIVLLVLLSSGWGCTAKSAKPVMIGSGLVLTTFGAVLVGSSAPGASGNDLAAVADTTTSTFGVLMATLGVGLMITGVAIHPDRGDERAPTRLLEDGRADAGVSHESVDNGHAPISDPRVIAGTRDPLRMYLAETCVGGDAAACRLLGVGVLRGTDVDPPDPEGASTLFDLACFMGDPAGCSLAGAL